ncbi:MAG: apolipoprotein N-acyltransferase [Bacteroidales bacterium]|nr:apolipoprotein N-acyltransferase [Bacteroidales bacterium]
MSRFKNIAQNKLFLSILSGILLSLTWTDYPIGALVLIAFIPLLLILEQLLKTNNKNNSTVFFLYSLLSFLIWNGISTYWMMYASVPGGIATIFLNSIFMAFVMYLTFISFKSLGRRIGYLVFVSNWVAFEYLLIHSQLSWPWMILGNAFSNSISLVQWYEFTGYIGGSAWIMSVNLLIFETVRQIAKNAEKKRIRSYAIGLMLLILLPVSYSLIRFNTYKEKITPVKVVIIQPNIDPYNEKFSTPTLSQIQKITQMAESSSDNPPDYFIAPETAISTGFYEDKALQNISVKYILDFLKDYPNSEFIIGATTRVKYDNPEDFTETATISEDNSFAHDVFNASVQISPDGKIQFYHKSKLVPGIETMPFPNITKLFTDSYVELGGINGAHGTQENRTVFINNNNNIRPGVAVCYESAYGEFITEFVSAGANVLFIITNDGWWKDTQGYRQHARFSKLRAVETRRSIARSANTGISCIINQKGQIVKQSEWWKKDTITGVINANENTTFYVKYGDSIPRIALVISVILLAIQIVGKLKKRIKG